MWYIQTSEESAAASEELSGQAQMLKDMVSKFQLPDDNVETQRMRYETTERTIDQENISTVSRDGGFQSSDKY